MRLNQELGGNSDSEVADAVDSQFTTAFRALVPNVDTLVDIHVVDLVTSGVPFAFTKTKNLAGTRGVSNASVPKGICPVLSLETDTAIRSGRGWQFLPSLLDSGTIQNGLINTSNAIWAAMATYGDLLDDDLTLGTNTGNVGVYSRTRALTAQTPFFFELTGYRRRQKPHWRRSRSLLEQ